MYLINYIFFYRFIYVLLTVSFFLLVWLVLVLMDEVGYMVVFIFVTLYDADLSLFLYLYFIYLLAGLPCLRLVRSCWSRGWEEHCLKMPSQAGCRLR